MSYSIERAPFGSTGHNSSRAIFGAAALGAMSQERADRTLDLMASYGPVSYTHLTLPTMRTV